MFVIGLSLLGARGRKQAPADDLDVALASAQIGLEKKRQRWLLFLIHKEEHCLNVLAQTEEATIEDERDVSPDN